MGSGAARTDAATVPDGDRDLTIWTWLRAVARPTRHCPRPGYWSCRAAQALPGDGPWMGGAQATSTEALPFDVIDLTPTTVAAYRPPASIDRPSITSTLSAGGRVAVAPGDAAEGPHFRALRRQHLPDHPASLAPISASSASPTTARSTFPCRHRPGRRPRPPARSSGASPAAGRQGPGSAGHRRVRRRPYPHGHGLGRRQEPRTRVHSRRRAIGRRCHQPGRWAVQTGGAAACRADQVEVVVRRQGQVILTAQYSELLAGGDIAIQKGDEIVVRPELARLHGARRGHEIGQCRYHQAQPDAASRRWARSAA